MARRPRPLQMGISRTPPQWGYSALQVPPRLIGQSHRPEYTPPGTSQDFVSEEAQKQRVYEAEKTKYLAGKRTAESEAARAEAERNRAFTSAEANRARMSTAIQEAIKRQATPEQISALRSVLGGGPPGLPVGTPMGYIPTGDEMRRWGWPGAKYQVEDQAGAMQGAGGVRGRMAMTQEELAAAQRRTGELNKWWQEYKPYAAQRDLVKGYAQRRTPTGEVKTGAPRMPLTNWGQGAVEIGQKYGLTDMPTSAKWDMTPAERQARLELQALSQQNISRQAGQGQAQGPTDTTGATPVWAQRGYQSEAQMANAMTREQWNDYRNQRFSTQIQREPEITDFRQQMLGAGLPSSTATPTATDFYVARDQAFQNPEAQIAEINRKLDEQISRLGLQYTAQQPMAPMPAPQPVEAQPPVGMAALTGFLGAGQMGQRQPPYDVAAETMRLAPPMPGWESYPRISSQDMIALGVKPARPAALPPAQAPPTTQPSVQPPAQQPPTLNVPGVGQMPMPGRWTMPQLTLTEPEPLAARLAKLAPQAAQSQIGGAAGLVPGQPLMPPDPMEQARLKLMGAQTKALEGTLESPQKKLADIAATAETEKQLSTRPAARIKSIIDSAWGGMRAGGFPTSLRWYGNEWQFARQTRNDLARYLTTLAPEELAALRKDPEVMAQADKLDKEIRQVQSAWFSPGTLGVLPGKQRYIKHMQELRDMLLGVIPPSVAQEEQGWINK